jgi:putative ABC transport system substrate-binding protein
MKRAPVPALDWRSVDRRVFVITSAALAAMPFAGFSQTLQRVFRIGVLETFPVVYRGRAYAAFDEELRKRGYVEGHNLIFERRDAAGQVDRLQAIAAELVALQPDLIVASAPQPNRALKGATSTIPIVMVGVADPVQLGLVESLARPGGNVTGVATMVPEGFGGKTLQLLHETVPTATRIAVLINPTNEMHRRGAHDRLSDATRLGIHLQVLEVTTTEAIEPAIDSAVRDRCHALYVVADPLFNFPTQRLPQLAARARLPAMFLFRPQAEAGGLLSYGPDVVDLYRRSAAYVDKILKGAKPADLPVEQPTKFELVINAKTASMLGITIPQSVLLRADEVIR